MILFKAVLIRCGWILFFHFIISISLLSCPVSGTEADYLYDIGAEGLLADGDMFDFENAGLSGSLASANNPGRIIPSGVVTFDIGASRDGEPHHPTGSTTSSADRLKLMGSNDDAIFNNSGVPPQDSNMRHEQFQSKLSRTGDYVFGTLLVIFGFISLLGNGCILLIFCVRHRRLSPAEVFLVNLGIVDILLAIASYPMSMISSFRHRWDFGELGCTLYAFICYFLGVASIFSVTAIALIRYLKTCHPAKGNQINNLTSCKMIGWGYLVALIWAGLPLLGFGNYEREPFGLSCTLDWVAKDKGSQLYLILVTIFCVFLPLFIIIFSYSQIIMLVKQSDNLVRSNGVMKRNTKGSDVQLTWISGLVSLGFIIGWGPYSVISLWATYKGEVVLPIWATPIPVLMAKSSIAYNPVIYFFFTTRYRKDFTDLLHGWAHTQGKGGKQAKTKNNNRQGSSSKPCTTKTITMTECGGQDSSESMSLTGKQLGNSSQVTPLHYPMDRNCVFLQYGGTPKNNDSPNNNNNNDNSDDNDNHQGDNEFSYHNGDAAPRRPKACILYINDNEESDPHHHQPHPPPSHHLIAAVKGKGTNTMLSTTAMIMASSSSSSSSRKLLGVSPSLLSICSGSSYEAEERV